MVEVDNRNIHITIAQLMLEVKESHNAFPDTDMEFIATHLCRKHGLDESMAEILVLGADMYSEASLHNWAMDVVNQEWESYGERAAKKYACELLTDAKYPDIDEQQTVMYPDVATDTLEEQYRKLTAFGVEYVELALQMDTWETYNKHTT